MKAVITVKLSPETKGEAIDTFAKRQATFRDQFEKWIADGGLSGIPGTHLPPENTTVRFMLDLPKFSQ